MFRTAAALMLAAAGFISSSSLAQTALTCAVHSVHDGDSMRVRCPGERGSIAIRMEQIDAPELEQAYGTRARDQLRRLCPVGSPAIVHVQGRDQYGRVLGNVTCDGKSVNEEMVAAGAAWLYDRYVTDRGLYALQDRARAQKRGLWAAKNPEAPWRWRYRQRQGN